jgi:oligogalacturonate lyase-like protein
MHQYTGGRRRTCYYFDMRATRRSFLTTLATSALHGQSEKSKSFPPEWRRYSDPATEFEVYRLTDPAHSSQLTAYYNRTLAHRSAFLLFSSDRTGTRQAFRMDLKSGECRQVTQSGELDPGSLTLLPDDRGFCLFDGRSLRHVNIANARDRQVYQVPDGWKRGPGFSVTGDGLSGLFSEVRDQSSRLRRVSVGSGVAATVVETAFTPSDPVAAPCADSLPPGR